MTAAHALIGPLDVNTKTFDGRTFEYGGHVSYSFTTLGATRTLNILTHDNDDCGSGQCASEPHYITKCRITGGDTDYVHSLRAKILKNGVEVETRSNPCQHNDGAWKYTAWYFADAPYVGDLDDVWKYRVSILDNGGTQQDSNDVIL